MSSDNILKLWIVIIMIITLIFAIKNHMCKYDLKEITKSNVEDYNMFCDNKDFRNEKYCVYLKNEIENYLAKQSKENEK